MRELTTVKKANILIKAATGEEYGDGYTVTDLCVGYAEPGYGNDDTVVVFGNWNPKRFPFEGEKRLARSESVGPRLADALTSIGAEVEWLDEWAVCDDCRRGFRIQPDSYGWTMYGAFEEDGYYCADCMKSDVEGYLSDYVNDSSKAVTWCDGADLEKVGYCKWNRDTFESGWHPGQNADPESILDEIHAELPDGDVVFLIDYNGQFDTGFSAYVKENVDTAENVM